MEVEAVLGIDPGVIGAWALVTVEGRLVDAGHLPVVGEGKQRMISPALLHQRLTPYVDCFHTVVMERVQSSPQQGVSTAFKFGRAYGCLEGFFQGSGCTIEYITPQAWKRHCGLRGGPAYKDLSRVMALNRWPGAAALLQRKKDVDRAEAALIAATYLDLCRNKGARPIGTTSTI